MNEDKRIIIVLHNPKGIMGMVGSKLQARGYQLEVFCPLQGDTLPSPETVSAAVIFGGSMSVNDSDKLPPLRMEMDWIHAFVNMDKPYLGICLGAQLLARSFGGSVAHHHSKLVEIGYYHIYPTVEGFNNLFANAPDKFFQWHNEGFTIPPDAVKLAASDLYPNQAFRIGKNAYGFQFHPEATRAQIENWHHRAGPEKLANPGAQTPNMQFIDCEKFTPHISHWLDNFLDVWLRPLEGSPHAAR